MSYTKDASQAAKDVAILFKKAKVKNIEGCLRDVCGTKGELEVKF